MNPEVKAAWLDALRSGKYKQGKDALHITDAYTGEDRYCCLGVLCEVSVEQGLELDILTPEQAGYNEYWLYNDGYEAMPREVMDWAGIPHNKPGAALGMFNEPVEVDGVDYLNVADMNDSGFTFEQIADIIEKEF